MRSPSSFDAVLGGKDNHLATAAVLGGKEPLARLFDLFNQKAKLCNGHYYRLELTPEVALVGRIRRSPLEELKVKILQVYKETYEYKTFTRTAWEFAGYLKHDGALFLPHRATYDPAKCNGEFPAIVLPILVKAGGKQ